MSSPSSIPLRPAAAPGGAEHRGVLLTVSERAFSRAVTSPQPVSFSPKPSPISPLSTGPTASFPPGSLLPHFLVPLLLFFIPSHET